MKRSKSSKLILLGVFTVIIALLSLIQIKTGIRNANVNFGTVAVFASVFFFSDIFSPCIAAGLGSAIIDLITKNAIYSPATLVIQASVALIAAIAIRNKNVFLKALLLILSATIIPIGYFLYELILQNDLIFALLFALIKCLQAVIGLVCGTIIGNCAKKIQEMNTDS